jgi:hypothetical protein
MSKERALRRAEREATEQAAKSARARKVARKAKQRELARRLKPRLPKRGRVGKLYPRRTPGQRGIIVLVVAAVLGLIWYEFDDITTRIALTAIVLLVLPAAVVIAFGRRTG